jgi:hypothetical protein
LQNGGGELEYSGGLKTRKLLENREAENAVAAEIAPNWNVSGTQRKSDFKKRAFPSDLTTWTNRL